MSQYKLSIIVPTFNSQADIAKTFDSIKSQTIGFESIEVIFVDDNSSDDTLKILNDYSNKYDNVNVFKTDENSGFAGKPRNIGLEKSNARYVLFLDGDDQLLVDSCEFLLNNIKTNRSDIAIGAHINRYDGNILEHIPSLPLGNQEVFKSTDDINLLNITPAISAKLFKKESLIKNNIRFVEGIPAQDLVFLQEAILNSKTVSISNNQYIYYRNIHSKSVSYNITEKYLTGLIKAYTLIADLFKKHSVDINIQEAVFKRHLGFFASQVKRAKHYNKLSTNELNEILSSKSFDELAKKEIFTDNMEFAQYFKYMANEKFSEAKNTVNNLKLNIHTNDSYLSIKNEIECLNNKNKTIQNHNTTLTEENNNFNNRLAELQKDINSIESKRDELAKENSYLKSENSNLKKELNEIKSSKLWRLINRH